MRLDHAGIRQIGTSRVDAAQLRERKAARQVFALGHQVFDEVVINLRFVGQRHIESCQEYVAKSHPSRQTQELKLVADGMPKRCAHGRFGNREVQEHGFHGSQAFEQSLRPRVDSLDVVAFGGGELTLTARRHARGTLPVKSNTNRSLNDRPILGAHRSRLAVRIQEPANTN
ncbi:MAG: hypothetical protein IAG13_30215 [Deltaproteobacteria bacterium]|nr:hypothetical protein [Nannocystaceae bacterium]